MSVNSQKNNNNLVVASGNMGKVEEFKQLLSGLSLNIISQPDGVKVDETGETFSDNAKLKALYVAKFTGEFALADDSGLVVEALDGAPGVYSARYGNTDKERVDRLLRELLPFKNRNASFISSLCLASAEDGVLFEVEGRCEGIITYTARGNKGFGYDPVFEVRGTGLTFAEMRAKDKRLLSHRGKAFEALMPSLKKLFSLKY